MPKLPVVSSLELIKYLKDKGFEYHHTSGSHHILVSPNRPPLSIPERKEIGKGLLRAILAEAGIEVDVFIQEWYG